MDSAEKIAIAELASLLSKDDLINPYTKTEVWPDILRRAGFSTLAMETQQFLTPYVYSGSYQNDNPKFNKRYSAIYSIFSKFYEDEDPFTEEYVTDMDSIRKILEVTVEEINPLDTVVVKLDYLEESLLERTGQRDKTIEKKKIALLLKIESDITQWETYGTDSIRRFIRSLRILSLDLKVEKGRFQLRPLTTGVVGREGDISSLEVWLSRSHPEVLRAYSDAIENYQEGRSGSCIADCRVALTGLFSNYADTEQWFNGVLKLTPDTYKDQEQVLKLKDASKIMQDKIEGQFPRFKVVYRIYALYCELGSHRTEGVEEQPTMNDALWSLRLLEDVLIWTMNVLPSSSRKING
jgi:hypothetical protein